MIDFELAVSQALSRSRLLETMLHGSAPWSAIIYTPETEHRIPLERTILPDDMIVVLTGYVGPGCQNAISAEVYCGMELVTAINFPGEDGPFRLVVERGIEVVAA